MKILKSSQSNRRCMIWDPAAAAVISVVSALPGMGNGDVLICLYIHPEAGVNW